MGAYGINGTFFDTASPQLSRSTWGISINDYKPIGQNASVNHWKSNIKRGTFIYDGERIVVERINNINESKLKAKFAVGGVGLIPDYDPVVEKVPSDILRNTHHTAIAFKGRDVYLIITKKECSMNIFRGHIKRLGVDGAVALDGGGSTQMLYKDNKGRHTSRKLNTIIGIKNV
ncbi:phosphodiester glycosidase family protein [Peptoniphilus ovalis]|uniref:phosphodiester glycosidase family protein n=1 Tax=Peptoniphilus ovalis TaxID=2841503 RepID=UPI0031BAE64A